MITMNRKVLFVTAITGLVILASSMRCENAAKSLSRTMSRSYTQMSEASTSWHYLVATRINRTYTRGMQPVANSNERC